MEPLGRAYLRSKVRDPVVRGKLTPRYAIGCKRPGFHNSYLSTFNRDNVRLVTEPIDKITPSAVATTDGDQPRDRRADTGDRLPACWTPTACRRSRSPAAAASR